jgi:choline dehydrogenase-like flavoprotein
VGRRFTEHLAINLEGSIDVPAVNDSQIFQVARSYGFYEAFKQQGLGSMVLRIKVVRADDTDRVPRINLAADLEMYPVATNRVTLSDRRRDPLGDPLSHLAFSYSPEDHATLGRARAVLDDIARRLGARDVQPRSNVVWAHHHLGTLSMGNDPRTSVVDANLRVHGIANLFVVSSGTFVTSGPANPTLLIVALAHRLADHLVHTLRARRIAAAGDTGTMVGTPAGRR